MPESKANTRRQEMYLSPAPYDSTGSLFLYGEESFPDDEEEEEAEGEVPYLAFRQRYWEAIVTPMNRCHLSDLATQAFMEDWRWRD